MMAQPLCCVHIGAAARMISGLYCKMPSHDDWLHCGQHVVCGTRGDFLPHCYMCLWEHAVCQAAQVCSGPGCRQRFELSRVGEPPTEGTPEPQADTYRCSPYVTCSQAVVAPQACWPCCLHLLQANCFSGLLGLHAFQAACNVVSWADACHVSRQIAAAQLPSWSAGGRGAIRLCPCRTCTR